MTVFLSEGIIQRRNNVSFRDGYVKLIGRKLHYVDYGGVGELVVALHGYVQNAHAFDGIASALVPHVRLLALDVRGRGRSDRAPADRYRMLYYLRDLSEFANQLRLTNFALIGTSMGGTLAALYAMANPRKVTRLVLNDIAMDSNLAATARAAGQYARAPARFATLRDAIAWFVATRENVESLDEQSREAWVSHFLTPAEDGGFRFNCDPVLFKLAGRVGRDPVSTREARQRMVWKNAGNLNMPILLLRGAHSDVVSPESAHRMVAALPNAISVEVPAVGHSPTLYEPASKSALREFFGIGSG
jgi:pimeloyl-ACP methyl ester carboxylesterase